jgi:predicted nuclease of predicted toxin-antitoxin system
MATFIGPPPKVIWCVAAISPLEVAALLREHVEAIQGLENSAATCLEIY